CLPHKTNVVIDDEILRCMNEDPDRCHHFGLDFPVGCLQLISEVLINSCGTCPIKKHHHYKFLFHDLLRLFVVSPEIEESLIIILAPSRDVSISLEMTILLVISCA